MKNQPKVSIIMNCYNGEKFLKTSINSLINQSYKNFEIIFYDNKSTDNSINIIKSFKNKRIRIFSSKKKLKLYKARNSAIKKAKGKYLTFLDTDDIWNRDKLQRQMDVIDQNKLIKIIYTNYNILKQKKKLKYQRFNYALPSGKITKELINNYTIGIATVLIKKELFDKFKFDETYDIIGDFDLMIKLSWNNKIHVIQKPLATYRIHGSNLSTKRYDLYSSELKRWIFKNKKKFEKKGFSLRPIRYSLLKIEIKRLLSSFLGISWGM